MLVIAFIIGVILTLVGLLIAAFVHLNGWQSLLLYLCVAVVVINCLRLGAAINQRPARPRRIRRYH